MRETQRNHGKIKTTHGVGCGICYCYFHVDVVDDDDDDDGDDDDDDGDDGDDDDDDDEDDAVNLC